MDDLLYSSKFWGVLLIACSMALFIATVVNHSLDIFVVRLAESACAVAGVALVVRR